MSLFSKHSIEDAEETFQPGAVFRRPIFSHHIYSHIQYIYFKLSMKFILVTALQNFSKTSTWLQQFMKKL